MREYFDSATIDKTAFYYTILRGIIFLTSLALFVKIAINNSFATSSGYLVLASYIIFLFYCEKEMFETKKMYIAGSFILNAIISTIALLISCSLFSHNNHTGSLGYFVFSAFIWVDFAVLWAISRLY